MKANEKAQNRGAARSEVSSDGVMHSGDFAIDLTRRRAALGGRDLNLTSEEFDVLLFLAGHPQSVISPRTMLATSWSSQRVRQIQFMRALMSLRAKLDAAAAGKRYLRTEPWIIYQFDPTSQPAP